jgi:hypothetical protein
MLGYFESDKSNSRLNKSLEDEKKQSLTELKKVVEQGMPRTDDYSENLESYAMWEMAISTKIKPLVIP